MNNDINKEQLQKYLKFLHAGAMGCYVESFRHNENGDNNWDCGKYSGYMEALTDVAKFYEIEIDN